MLASLCWWLHLCSPSLVVLLHQRPSSAQCQGNGPVDRHALDLGCVEECARLLRLIHSGKQVPQHRTQALRAVRHCRVCIADGCLGLCRQARCSFGGIQGCLCLRVRLAVDWRTGVLLAACASPACILLRGLLLGAGISISGGCSLPEGCCSDQSAIGEVACSHLGRVVRRPGAIAPDLGSPHWVHGQQGAPCPKQACACLSRHQCV
mmetsp:Transcript_15268/g.38073  ORF Transcript_15268/g.38073 Transcript_15268/m.38073 type:complete len:207 (-) Transcript_15268:2-622(-)